MDYSMAEIRAFNATLQAGNFTRAADLLEVSQPAITAQIRKLESRFSTPLLERLSKGVRATDLGKQLYQITRQYHDLEAAIEVLSNPTLSPGKMTLQVANASSIIFMPLIAEFSRRFPQTTLKIKSVTTSECRALVLNREVDIGLFPLLDESSELSRLAFSSHRLVAVLRPDHPLAEHKALSVSQLVGEPLIVYKPEACTQQLLEQLFVRNQLRVSGNVVVDGRLDMSEAVSHGLGIGFALQQDIRPDPRLTVIPITEATEDVVEHVVWMKNRRSLPGIRDFIQLALEQRCGALSEVSEL
ncbi:LysR family transcriptional regulator [Amphritea pacifica]|uniref:LysR family transcriptional regulator n=1 Tax=Amphritea pacifica TaxID=2811233 RepID=A0ABS2WD22_9GAMM|nr:LysR family transcriptional regulator [Amphritea pacifica]MBN0989614.1 LysR family transcriptional regulator [Amphritea pacifica]MBN1006555.1 LysR family transcriptional regulator [Amphritea pacifica]